MCISVCVWVCVCVGVCVCVCVCVHSCAYAHVLLAATGLSSFLPKALHDRGDHNVEFFGC